MTSPSSPQPPFSRGLKNRASPPLAPNPLHPKPGGSASADGISPSPGTPGEGRGEDARPEPITPSSPTTPVIPSAACAPAPSAQREGSDLPRTHASGVQNVILSAGGIPITSGSKDPAPPNSQIENRQSQIPSPSPDLSQSALIRLNFKKHRLAVWSGYVLTVIYLLAIFAPFFSPAPPNRFDLDHPYCPPQLLRFTPTQGLYTHPMILQIDPVTLRRTYYEDRSTTIPLALFARGHFLTTPDPNAPFYPLGTDRYGRDILSRILHGARVSLSVGLVGVAVTFLLGTLIGGISGYAAGRTDTLIQRATEIVNAFPQLPLWMAIAALLPSDWSPLAVYFAITVVLSLLGWTGLSRVVRGKILALREEDYAVAARLLGASHARVLFRHLVPGFASHIIVALTLSIPAMILGETSLSFLGIGLRPPIVSWGVMLQDCMDVQAVRYYPWLLTPVLFIVTAVLCFNFLGDGLRDAADPYSAR